MLVRDIYGLGLSNVIVLLSGKNHFTDEDGYVVYDIFSYITPNELTWFLHNKESLCFIRADGYFIEVNYLEDK